MKHYSDGEGCAIIVLAILLAIILTFINPAILMWLWNWIAVDLFSAPIITYWQAFGLSWLCGILFRKTVTVKTKG